MPKMETPLGPLLETSYPSPSWEVLSNLAILDSYIIFVPAQDPQ
jgi:hypothetical protein